MQHSSRRPAGHAWPVAMAFVRLPLLIAGSGAFVLGYRLAGEPVGIEAGLAWSPVTLTAVNVFCLWLLLWRCRVEGISLLGLVGFRRDRWLRDIGIGIAMSLWLWVLLSIGILAVVLTLHPSLGFRAFETSFVGDADFDLHLPLWLAVFSAVVFPTVNAPVEELQYRGYAQSGLIRASCRPRAAIVLTALGFGVQHVTFALTVTAALAYGVGFFLWGLGAGWIAWRQQRLAPLIVAHFLSNLSFGVLPLVFVLGE